MKKLNSNVRIAIPISLNGFSAPPTTALAPVLGQDQKEPSRQDSDRPDLARPGIYPGLPANCVHPERASSPMRSSGYFIGPEWRSRVFAILNVERAMPLVAKTLRPCPAEDPEAVYVFEK